MVAYGHPTTVHATLEMMETHVAAVRRGAPDMFVVADMPFLTARRGPAAAAEAAGKLLQAGANAVKIEGIEGHAAAFRHVVGSGIPVMGHLGLTPQSYHQLGGNRIQGRAEADAARIRREAAEVARCGAFALVIECVPAELASAISADLSIPTIGIGAGPGTSGQVVVLSDLLGLDARFRPRFVRRYLDGHAEALAAVNAFARDVRASRFPAPEEVLL
jgi:3-methyl-2-oxobutanoate hydroxymethyltransferase